MKIKLLLSYDTEVGTFYIGQSLDGRFHPIFDGESYGSYYQVWQAIEDLSNDAVGEIYHPITSELLDITDYDLPLDYQEWETA
jgi:hypothetical protein